MKRNEEMKKRKNNKGFSLVELIVVVAIMAILAGVLAPQFVKYLGKSRVATDIQNGQQIAAAISAQFAEDATNTTKVLPALPITDMNVSADAAASSDEEKVQKVIGGAPQAKFGSGNSFYVSVTADGEVTVTVGTDTDKAAAGQVYPDTTGEYEQQ